MVSVVAGGCMDSGDVAGTRLAVKTAAGARQSIVGLRADAKSTYVDWGTATARRLVCADVAGSIAGIVAGIVAGDVAGGVNPKYRTRGWKHSHTGGGDWVQGRGTRTQARAQARAQQRTGQGVQYDDTHP